MNFKKNFIVVKEMNNAGKNLSQDYHATLLTTNAGRNIYLKSLVK
jgi:hypothetical protein